MRHLRRQQLVMVLLLLVANASIALAFLPQQPPLSPLQRPLPVAATGPLQAAAGAAQGGLGTDASADEDAEDERLWQAVSRSSAAVGLSIGPGDSGSGSLEALEAAFPLRELEKLRDNGDPGALVAAVRRAAEGVWATGALSSAAATTAGATKKKPGRAASSSSSSSTASGSGSRRKPPRREVMMGTALELFLSILAEEEKGVGGGLAPDSWCFTSVVDALVRGGRPNLALLLLERAYMQAASPRGLTLVYKHKERSDEPPPPGMESGIKMVLTSAIGSLEEAGHEDLTDAVYREALRRGALDGYWSMVHPGVVDLHNKTVSLARAAVRHCYAQTLLADNPPDDTLSPPSSSSTEPTSPLLDKGEGPFFEIIIGRGKSLSPAVLQLLNEEFAPAQEARVKEDNPGRIEVPRERIRAWVDARRQ